MGNHSNRLNPKKNGTPPHTITTGAQFEHEINTLMSRTQGTWELWYFVAAALGRAQHKVQQTMDGIEQELADQEQANVEKPEGDEDREPKKPAPEYPH